MFISNLSDNLALNKSSAIAFIFAIAYFSLGGAAPSAQVYILAVVFFFALMICAWTVFEIDSWNTLALKVFPFCFVPFKHEQEDEETVPARPRPPTFNRLPSIKDSIPGLLRIVYPSQQTAQRTEWTEMHRMA